MFINDTLMRLKDNKGLNSWSDVPHPPKASFKFAPTLGVVQIYLHPGANCAHKRKMFNFCTF